MRRDPALARAAWWGGSLLVLVCQPVHALATPPHTPAQATVSLTLGTQTRQDSLRDLQRRAHDDTVAYLQDSAAARGDSLAGARRRAAVIPLTPALLATAFRDAHAPALLAGARRTRLVQDSSLTSYDATTYERFSMGVSMSHVLRERLLFRTERTTHVRWSRESGAVIDITGERSATPALGGQASGQQVGGRVPIPYFPGRDALWIGSGLAKANVSDFTIMNPLAHGAEAYYTYATGDSLALQLSDTHRIVVRELRVRPRAPQWNVVVGSLWFDVSSGHLVRAVYRLAEPLDVLAANVAAGDDPRSGMSPLARAFVPAITAQVTDVTIDYGLYEGRFWLPRTQTMDGQATVGALHVPMQIQEHFDYATVNGPLGLPPVQVNPLDTATSIAAYVTRDTARRHECVDTSGQQVRTATWYNETLPVVIHTPCDTVALVRSPTLPPSIYASTDTLFHGDERMALVNGALGLSREPALAPQQPTVHYGVGYTRYNRVEGLSTAIDVQQIYGAGYTTHALFRFGVADRSPDGELGVTRSNDQESFTLSGYRRLDAANDWGNPFSPGASLTAVLFGRDDGIYYRTWGAELTHEQQGGVFDSWRLFAEHQFDATTRTQFSLPHAFDGHLFRGNNDIDVTDGSVVGLALRRRGVFGDDPTRFRAVTDLRLEGVTGSFDYVRGMLDLTLDQPLSAGLSGVLTLSGGTSGGHLPTQRLWYLGGPYTVRGQPIASASGDAYWLTRAELGGRSLGFRPFVFADLGWAGDRTQWTTGVQPMSGAGVGASVMDGLFHVDLARGVHPVRGAQIDAYLDTRF
ncbi:MAG TPA: ShlB/FhaC/HecB family hemolysin secretion/activation protein [Gemmatimonadaceae bacterium]|jgi:hypothetical protein|nr:ShlB/FhaC/HecB family hemolysin secretion/activation protein [Gemmatimonadaceae bacterium]